MLGYNFQKCFCLKIFFAFANGEDPDEMQHNAAFHLGLHRLQKYSIMGFPNTLKVKIVKEKASLSILSCVFFRNEELNKFNNTE